MPQFKGQIGYAGKTLHYVPLLLTHHVVALEHVGVANPEDGFRHRFDL